MRRIIVFVKVLVKIAIAPLILLAVAEISLRYVIHNKMLELFQHTLEKQFQGEISFLDVDIVTISNFPIATLTIDSINLQNENHELFSAAKVKAYLDLNKLYKRRHALEKLELAGVQLYLPVDTTGQLLTIQSTGDADVSPKGNLEMEIPEIIVHDLSIVFENQIDATRIQMTLDSGVFEQKSTEDLFQINGNAYLTVDTRMNSLNYEKHNPSLQLYTTFRNAAPGDSISAPHIRVDFGIQEAIYQPDGRYNKIDSINLKGYYSNGAARNSSSSKVVIDYGKLNFDDSYFNFSGEVQNFDDPLIQLDLNADFHLNDLQQMLNLEEMIMTGDVRMHAAVKGDLATLDQGLASAGEISTATFSIDHVNIDHRNKDLRIQNLNGQFSLQDARLEIERLDGKYNGTAISAKGRMDNFLPLLGLKKGQNSKASLDVYAQRLEIPKVDNESTNTSNSNDPIIPEFLELDLKFRTDELFYDSLSISALSGSMLANSDTIKMNFKTSQMLYDEVNASGLKGALFANNEAVNLNFQTDQLVYDSITVSDLSGAMYVDSDSINLQNANFKFEKGNVKLSAISKVNSTKQRSHQVILNADLPYLDVNKYLSDSQENDTTSNANDQAGLNLDLTSNIKIAKLKYNNITLDQLHLKSRLNDSSFNASILGFNFPFGRLQSALSVDWTDTSYALNGVSTARLKGFHIDSLKSYYNNLDLGQKGDTSSADSQTTWLIEKYTMNFSAPEAIYDDHQLQNVSATLTVRDNDIKIHRAKFDMYDGTFGLNGAISFDQNAHTHIVCNLQAGDLSLGEIITKLGPEEEELFGKEHFNGRLDLDGSIILKYDQELDHQEQDMIGKINVSLREGEVINFSPITESLKFIKHENRETIYLANPDFKILFHNDELVIPTTIFKTSLTNIELSGYHGDEDNFRYDVMISMNDLFFKSKDKIKDQVKAEDSTAVGRLKHHITVRTTDEEMKVSFLSKKRYEEQLSGLQETHQKVDSILQVKKVLSQ